MTTQAGSALKLQIRGDPRCFFSDPTDKGGIQLEALVSEGIVTKKRSAQGVICSLQSRDEQSLNVQRWKAQIQVDNEGSEVERIDSDR